MKEYKYYLEIRQELAKENHGKYVAIKGKQVLGIFDNYRQAADAVYLEHDYGTVLMQELGRGPGSTDIYIYTPGIVPVK
jgi:hypothetical protein